MKLLLLNGFYGLNGLDISFAMFNAEHERIWFRNIFLWCQWYQIFIETLLMKQFYDPEAGRMLLYEKPGYEQSQPEFRNWSQNIFSSDANGIKC